MASSFEPDRQKATQGDPITSPDADRLPEEILAPVMAGAHARGVAETLDLLGLAGLILDRDARVLFASDAAAPFLTGPLRIRTNHLLAEQAGDNHALSDLIAVALSGASGDVHSVGLPHSALRLHAVSMPDRLAATGQFLRAIVLLDDAHDPVISALVGRWTADRR